MLQSSTVDGTFLVATPGKSWTSLFQFSFAPLSNGVIASQGAWTPASSAPGSYQFIVTGEGSFLLIVNDATTTTTMSGSKALKPAEQTFFQKYGCAPLCDIAVCNLSLARARARKNHT